MRALRLAPPLLLLAAACTPQAAPRRHSSTRVVPPADTGARVAASPGRVRTIAPSKLLEEETVGMAGGITPAMDAPAPPPTATPERVAALPPAATTPGMAAPTDESVLTHIGPSTPPNVAAALRLIEDGRQQMNQQRYDRALDRFERAVAVDPSNAHGYYYLAQLHFQMKKYDQAVAFASRAVVLSARSDRVLQGRAYGLQGAAYEAVGRYADARRAYTKAVEADPNNLAARVGVARLNPGQQESP